MSTYAERLAEDRRAVILTLLVEAPGYGANAGVIHAALPSLGHAVSADQVASDLAWLAEQGLVALEAMGPVTVARLVARGLDVAAGRAVVPGVRRPSP